MSKKTSAIILALVALIAATTIYFVLQSRSKADDMPPQLSINLPKLQGSTAGVGICRVPGMLALELDGEFTPPAGATADDLYEMPAGTHMYHNTKTMSVQDIIDSMVPVAGQKFLFAMYSPEASDGDGNWYLYPDITTDYLAVDDPETFVVTPYRGYVLFTCKETQIYNVKNETMVADGLTDYLDDVDSGWVLVPDFYNYFDKKELAGTRPSPRETGFWNRIQNFTSAVWLQGGEGFTFPNPMRDKTVSPGDRDYHMIWVKMGVAAERPAERPERPDGPRPDGRPTRPGQPDVMERPLVRVDGTDIIVTWEDFPGSLDGYDSYAVLIKEGADFTEEELAAGYEASYVALDDENSFTLSDVADGTYYIVVGVATTSDGEESYTALSVSVDVTVATDVQLEVTAEEGEFFATGANSRIALDAPGTIGAFKMCNNGTTAVGVDEIDFDLLFSDFAGIAINADGLSLYDYAAEGDGLTLRTEYDATATIGTVEGGSGDLLNRLYPLNVAFTDPLTIDAGDCEQFLLRADEFMTIEGQPCFPSRTNGVQFRIDLSSITDEDSSDVFNEIVSGAELTFARPYCGG